MDAKRKSSRLNSVRDLDVYKMAFDTAMIIFTISKKVSEGRKICINRSGSKIFTISLCKSCRRLEKEKVSSCLCK